MKLIIALMLALPSIAAASDQQRWDFNVYLDDRPIGEHRFDLSRASNRTVVETTASFDVKFLFVTAFKYRHDNRETWQDGCLETIEARTNNNGDILTVTGSEASDRFEIMSRNGSATLPGCIQSFAYWNPSILGADRLLNAQTGEYESVEISLDGEDVIDVAGQPLEAERYRISLSRGDILLWYTRQHKTWVALDAPAKGDRRIRYEAKRVPAATQRDQLMAGGQ